MITMCTDDRSGNLLWVASGNGPARPIVVEATTRADARRKWIATAAEQRQEVICAKANRNRTA